MQANQDLSSLEDCFFGDHPRPHCHAIYGQHVGLFNGDLPKRARKWVAEWAAMNKKELQQMWDNQEFHKRQPLD